MNNKTETPFGAFDSELMQQEIFIPEGFTATIEGDKVILKKTESEDEKTKRILHSISSKMSLHLGDIFTEEEFQCFDTWSNAWLEKQGEQKPIDKIQLGKKYKCIASPRYSTFRRGEIYKPEDKFLCSLMNFCYDCFEPIEDGEQKPAWSKEDKKMVKCCEIALEAFEKLGKNTQGFPHENYFELDEEKIYPSEVNRWLNFLPPQPKQKWGEEDEKMLNFCCEYLDDTQEDWLKSLKDRYTWKPSNEQMEALDKVLNCCISSWDLNSIYSLYNDLKKLTE